jgi:preprotein translocase subunit YajC
MFNFLLDATQNPGMGLGGFALTLVAFGLVFYFLILRPQKKRDQEATDMRNSLAVGDEVTTIGGIIGKVISIKEETFVLETTKDKTKIRFLKGAVRSIDVKIADVVAQTAEKTETEAPEQK